MKIKIRGENYKWINDSLEDKDVEIFVGHDIDGKEIFTGDLVIDGDGDVFKVGMTFDLDYLPDKKILSKYKLKE